MDAEVSVDRGEKTNHLQNVLSDSELSKVSKAIKEKINTYIDQKFEEYLTSKALLETSKSQIDEKIAVSESSVVEITAKYEDTIVKLAAADESASELGKQVEILNAELEKTREHVARLENELISAKSARDAAVDERNDLTRIIQRRDAEIERLTASEGTLSSQLRAAIDAKCEALALNDEIQSKELSLQYREKRMEQERVLLNSQITSLTEEVNRLTSELQTVRLNNTSRAVNLETQLAEKVEELNAANETIAQLNELKKNLTNRAENLSQRLLEQREIENKITENYKKELDAKSKLADLFKTMHDDAEAKTSELTDGIAELQKLLNEATEKYGELETKYKQAEMDHEEILEKKNEVIASLKSELENANDLLKAANAHNIDVALNDLAPSAAAASKLLKSGMSLTQVYSQLVKVSEDLSQEKEENRRLNITINSIVQELEEKAPMLQKQKTEYEEALENNIAITQQLDSLVMECNRLRDECSESSKIANHFNRENARLKGELADLGRQVCFLLKEVEQSRGGSMPNGDHDATHTSNTINSELNSSRLISKTLVTFRDIQELQSNNQKLLRMVRDLTEKQEEFERQRQEIENGETENKIEILSNRVTELTDAQERQTKMVNGLIRQRDMFKKLYHDYMKGKRHESSHSMDTFDTDNLDPNFVISSEEIKTDKGIKNKETDANVFEIKLKETEKQLEVLKEEYKTYKEEKVTNERMLFDQIDNMRREIAKLTAANSKCASTSEYNNERLKILQTNIMTYKKQIASLEEKNKVYNATIAKQEVSLQHLRDEALNAQSKLATAEVTVENLKLECKLLKDMEIRLQTEKEIMNRERQGQSLLLKNLEMIKASVERVETENRVRLESRLDETTRECSALRRRLQEEQDRFRELGSHLEKQTETAKARMMEEREAANSMRAEIAQLRQDLMEKNKSNEELAKKLKVSLTPNNSDGTFDSLKKIRELENKLNEKQDEIKLLNEQLKISKEHVTQYCNISECAEKELKNLNDEYNAYKTETEAKLQDYSQQLQNLQEKCSELEAELSLQTNGEHSNNTTLRSELTNTKEELKTALANLETCRTELELSRSEISKLSEAVITAEEKYAHEMVLHSADIQSLSQIKGELSKVQNEFNEITSMKESLQQQLETEKNSWFDREKLLTNENEKLMLQLEDLNKQNSLLHDQIQALGTQFSAAQASKSLSESMNESGNETNINISITDEDVKSSEQLFQIIKFLRKEKDIAMAKFDILQAENMRLKSQLEITEKKLDDCKLALAAEREKSEVDMVTLNRQSDILRKIETLNALTDSNRILREERDNLSSRVEELLASVKCLEQEIAPLQEKISELKSKNETLQSENNSLKADSARWRTRVNALVERANKTSPEDWKRLQNEREILAKMLTNEKESVKKLNDEVSAIKVEKTKLEEQYSLLSRQHASLVDENKKSNEELQTLNNDVSRLTEELSRVKAELSLASQNNTKLSEDLSSKDTMLADIRNKEMQIKKIAKKYKAQYEDLAKSVEDEKSKSEIASAASDAASAEAVKKVELQIAELQGQLETEKANNDKLKSELENLRTSNLDKEEKAKQVLKQAKTKIVQLTEAKNTLSRELNESRSKMEAMETSQDEHDVRLAVLKSQYEGRLSRLEKEKGEAQSERNREVEALLQKVNMLQRQLASQTAAAKQQISTEKTTSDPPTANIKPMAGVVQQSVSGSRRGGETPLASIRPMAQVGPTAPHDAHSTEYMPASSSRPLPRAAVAASTAPPESTQDMDTSEAGMGSSGSSDGTAQTSTHVQPPQQAVALVMPRIEQPTGAASSASASTVAAVSASTSSAATGSVTASVAGTVSASVSAPPTSVAVGGSAGSASEGGGPQSVQSSNGGGGVSTSHAPPDARPVKRPRPAHQRAHPSAKRTRVQGFERSVEVEYQVPTSSRCDQDDEGVIVVDSEEDDERCTGTTYREGEDEEEDMEDEQEVEGGEEEEEGDADGEGTARAPEQESPAQSPEAGEQGEVEEGGDVADGEDSERSAAAAVASLPHQQIEAISSGTEPSGALSLGGGGDDGDDSIVPSTPTLYVPRRNDGFGEAVVSPVGAGGGASSARFTFAEAGAASHHDTHADLAAALPPPHAPTATQAHPDAGGSEGVSAESGEGEARTDWEEARAEDDTPAVSSQGSQPSSPHHVPEEGREAEASASPGVARRRPYRAAPAPSPSHHHRWTPGNRLEEITGQLEFVTLVSTVKVGCADEECVPAAEPRDVPTCATRHSKHSLYS
ncbi:Nucleoprotein TPR [Eumeta japonica]|uniref:Nucleoprotein TPR n=1 Tax=Eumeta variegata TaxID=151549 RepID=A0A4C1YVS4_EUMVA|nr:Nucleoprotein TPR [Eumeta japonica]